MENLQALRRADEVRTFPDIQMPSPAVFKVHTGKGAFSKTKDLIADIKPKLDTAPLPGLLSAKQTKVGGARAPTLEDKVNVFTGFNSVNFKLDVASETPKVYEEAIRSGEDAERVLTGDRQRRRLSQITFGDALPNARATTAALNQARNLRPDGTVEELRNYIVLMDKYSLHNFLIYDGHALRDTPEFQSFQRSYQHSWGAIASIVQQLEDFLGKHDIKLAIVNGPRIAQMAKLNLPTLKRNEILSCLANSAQIEASIESGSNFARKQLVRCAVRLQAIVRMYIARRRYAHRLRAVRSAIVIQSFARRMLEKRMHKNRLKRHVTVLDERWLNSRRRMETWWREQASLSASLTSSLTAPLTASLPAGLSASSQHRSRLILFLPSLSVGEKLRFEYDNYGGLQNACISHLYLLADPSVCLVYISPVQMTSYQLAYHEKLLALMGVSLLPKRLHILVPEMSDKLPPCVTLAQQLWCSVQTLRKVKSLLKRFRHAELVCSTPGWAERRIASYLHIPLLGCDPHRAQILCNRSVFKSFLMESSVAVPIGAHDICGLEDLFVALARLIGANLGVIRWVIRLNCDHNREGTLFVDVERIPLVLELRNEQREVVGEKESLSAWFARPVQIEVRKRILSALKTDFLSAIRFARKDIYKSWDQFLRHLQQVGAVVEADPLEAVGTVLSPCFITPLGEVEQVGGVEAIADEFGQVQGYVYPQQITPPPALRGVSQELAQRLFEEQQVVGHVCFHLTSFWDGMDGQPRLWASDVTFGATPLFGALGTAAVVAHGTPPAMPLSLLPAIPEGRSFVYIPLAIHDPLRGTRDDSFFKLCRLRGIAFDTETRLGTLFFLADSILGGGVSLLCLGKTRRKSIELAVQALTFVQRNYGLDMTSSSQHKYENLTRILSSLKKMLKKEGELPIHSM